MLLFLFTSCEYQEFHYNPDGSAPIVTTKDLDQSKNSTPKAVISVKLGDLEKAFEDNQIEADGRYHDKKLRFTAPVETIDKSLLGAPQVRLVGTNEFLPTTCELNVSELQKAGKLKKGQKITVIGENPMVVIGLSLDHCEIVE